MEITQTDKTLTSVHKEENTLHQKKKRILKIQNQKLHTVWKEKYRVAKENMQKRRATNIVLIEVAAQHRLRNGELPNEEFEKRLLLGIEIYRSKLQENKQVYFYVPGSRHMENGEIDKISLSEAGKNYLISKGIPEEIIFADDKNQMYKGENGVYNSSDECFVACKIYDEIEAEELHCVCSSAQMMRKVLSYIHFGYVPYMHTVSCDNMYHDYINEIFVNIPILLDDEDGLQGDSDEAKRLRKLRKPEESKKVEKEL